MYENVTIGQALFALALTRLTLAHESDGWRGMPTLATSVAAAPMSADDATRV